MGKEKLIKCKKCNKDVHSYYLDEDGICGKCKYWSTCKQCGEEKHYSKMFEDDILCKDCHKYNQKEQKKLENGYKLCPFCGEQIKAIAIKCRFCNEMLDKDSKIKDAHKKNEMSVTKNNEYKKIEINNTNKDKNIEEDKIITPKNSYLANATLTFGIISIFFFEVGIIPLFAVIISITSFFKIQTMDKKHSMFTIIGAILSVIYFVVYLNAYGHI